MIGLTLQNGHKMSVPDDPANRHRRRVQEWVDQGQGVIQPADPAPKPTRRENMRNDPAYPFLQEFLEAQIACRYDSDCASLDAIHSRIRQLENKYP